jgi:hypothetical protein
MKSIINGLRYDTANAVLIGEAGYNGPTSDFQWWFAGLYRTPRSHRYFLAGEGNAMTRWGAAMGKGVIPLRPGEARAWAERYLTTDEIEAAFFGAEVEDA